MFAVDKWLITLAQKYPRLVPMAMLLVGISISGTVITYQYKEQIKDFRSQLSRQAAVISAKEEKIDLLQQRSELKDSVYKVQLFYVQQKANDEVQAFLIKINREQSIQIRLAAENERLRVGVYDNTKAIIKKGHSIIKNLNNAQ